MQTGEEAIERACRAPYEAIATRASLCPTAHRPLWRGSVLVPINLGECDGGLQDPRWASQKIQIDAQVEKA